MADILKPVATSKRPILERPPKSCENSGIMNALLSKELGDIMLARQRRELAWHAHAMKCTTVISSIDSSLASFVDKVEEEVVAFKAYLRQTIATFAVAESTAIPPQIQTDSRPNGGTRNGAGKDKSMGKNIAVATPRTILSAPTLERYLQELLELPDKPQTGEN
ncbi:hypothetical protein EPUL_004639 [Erysiphe pulchra]|uniref:Uncharacterized protein n=1 Tax=Erysiphe pulchra TaxID=225359 RepID=A0A2S4PTZ0_9PEZI|nr:hypothetical protein EPUL_004639 [Erysiphe pulchra]